MRKLVLTAVATVVAALVLASSATAAPPVETSFEATLVGVDVRSVTVLPSGTVVQEWVLSWAVTGDWTGTLTGLVRSVFHTSGVTTGSGVYTFTGSVLGAVGTAEIHHTGTFQADGSFKGTNTILGGTGGLAGLHGQGKNIVTGLGATEGSFLVLFVP